MMLGAKRKDEHYEVRFTIGIMDMDGLGAWLDGPDL